jgi:hypothetical protein
MKTWETSEMESLMELMQAAREYAEEEEETILHEAAIARLREAADRYNAINPYEIGDIITPRADAPMKGVGQPHLVVKVSRVGDFMADRQKKAGTWEASTRFDTICLCIMRGVIAPFAVSSWLMEPWKE